MSQVRPYAFIVPDALSVEIIATAYVEPIRTAWSFPIECATAPAELHCTLVYSQDKVAESAAKKLHDPELFVIVKPAEFKIFGDPERETLNLVLGLADYDEEFGVRARHRQWLGIGCTSSFPDYAPHITLFTNPHHHTGEYAYWREQFEAAAAHFNAVEGFPEDDQPLMLAGEQWRDIDTDEKTQAYVKQNVQGRLTDAEMAAVLGGLAA